MAPIKSKSKNSNDPKTAISSLLASKKDSKSKPVQLSSKSDETAKFTVEPISSDGLLNGIDLSAHDLTKYDKMKKIRIPEPSIRTQMRIDGVDPKVIATYFGDKLPGANGNHDDDGQVMKPPCPKPDMAKYIKMSRIGMPEFSVRNKMKMDGIHAYWVRDFYGEPQPIIGGNGSKVSSPKRAVKALHWKKKSTCNWDDTIWGKADELINCPSPISINSPSPKPITKDILLNPQTSKHLLKMFSNVTPNKLKNGGNALKHPKGDEEKEISLIEPKRAFNMMVGLRQFEKLGMDDIKIRNGLLKLDSFKFNDEMLAALGQIVPTNEELEQLRRFQGCKEKLARGDRFVLVMINLVDIKMRIDLWRFKMNFSTNLRNVEIKINKIQSTLIALKSSPALAGFMKICLIFGNFMNEGTDRGNAKGFKLESVDRFASMKTVDKKHTMLMFIMDRIDKEYGGDERFTDFPEALADLVEKASAIKAKTIRDGIGDMKASLERIGKQITRASRTLQQVQDQFYKSASSALIALTKMRRMSKKLHLRSASSGMTASSPRNVIFMDNEMLQSPKNGKPRKFKIIDPKYTGTYIIRNHIDRELNNHPQRSQLGNTKMIKVKIRRMRRVRPKGSGSISAKTMKTIHGLRAWKKGTAKRLKRIGSLPKAISTLKARSRSRRKQHLLNIVPKDKFESIMTGFHTISSNKVEALEKKFANLKVDAGKAAVFFGEHDDIEWEELFKIFLKFFELIAKAKKQNAVLAEEEEKRKKRKQRLSQKALSPKANGPVQPLNLIDEISKRRGYIERENTVEHDDDDEWNDYY